jgi:hypothetical protein
MNIENCNSMEGAKARYAKAERGELVMQQVGLRSSIHTVEWLIANRAEGATAEALLASLQEQLFVLHEVANSRGIHLLGYGRPS